MYDVSVWSLKLEIGFLPLFPAAARRNTKWRKTKPSDLDTPKNNRALQSFLGTMGEKPISSLRLRTDTSYIHYL